MTPRAVLLDTVVRTLYPAMLVVSLWILFRGHHEPGGGFIGGMVAVAATALAAVASGSHVALGRLPLGPLGLSSAGVAIALLSGLPAVFQGYPYLTHVSSTGAFGLTSLTVSTAFMFDVGVYLAVWGALGGIAAHTIGLDEPDEPDEDEQP